MNQLSNILSKLVPQKGRSNAAVGKKIGISGQLLGQYIAGTRNPKLDFYQAWKREFGEDLLKTIEADVSQETQVSEKSAPYGLPPGVEIVETTTDAKDYLLKRRALKNTSSPYMVPLVPVKAQAGYSKGFNNTDFLQTLDLFPMLPGIDPHGAEWRYFEIEGDSMLETFKDGQYILASQVIKEDWRNIENGYVYAIITQDKVMIKRLLKVKGKDYWAAASDNEKVPQFRLPVADVKELWKYRRHIDWDASPKKKIEVKV